MRVERFRRLRHTLVETTVPQKHTLFNRAPLALSLLKTFSVSGVGAFSVEVLWPRGSPLRSSQTEKLQQ